MVQNSRSLDVFWQKKDENMMFCRKKVRLQGFSLYSLGVEIDEEFAKTTIFAPMKAWILPVLLVLISSCKPKEKDPMYKANKEKKILEAHGEMRIDDFYWMRLSDEQKIAPEKDSQTKAVFEFLEHENSHTEKMMASTQALQASLFDEITGRIKQDDSSVPYFNNGYWYYTRFEEGQEYPVYCRKRESLEATEDILLDVNELSKGHDYYDIGGLSISQDNKVLSYGVDIIGRRIYTIYFKDLETGELLTDMIENTTGSCAWSNDHKTLFYTDKNKTTLLSEKIMRHVLGSDSSEDVLVYEEKDKTYYNGVYKSKSDKYIIITNSSTLSSDYWILDADDPNGSFKNFSPREDEHEYGIAHYQDKFYILTNDEAQNFRLMETDIDKTEKKYWREILPHRENVYIENIEVFKNHLVIEERTNGQTKLRIIDQKTQDEHYIAFDEEAFTTWISTNPEFDSPFLRFGYSSLTTPSSVYDYNFETRERELKKQQEIVGGHDPKNYASERIEVPSRDGKTILMSLVYKKGFNKNGSYPVLQYAYGAYGHTIDPSFSAARLSLLDRGFAFAIAHIRGGQMLGRSWYDDGKVLNKINTFNDFIDCSKYLINHNYTSASSLYAMGGSAGGLLIGAIINMNPELYHGVIAAVPFVDVLTTMSDATIPLTTNEYDEWGNPENKDEYDYIKSYSPYDNVSQQKYPNILVTTGLYDSQVQYWEPAKWVARLRELKTDDNLLLLHTNMDTGHSGTTGRFKAYKETAMEYAFLLMLQNISN